MLTIASILRSRQNIFFVALAVVLTAAFALWFGQLPPHQPALFLTPVSWFVSAFCGVDFTCAAERGYLAMSHAGSLFSLDKSCSGGNFFMMLFPLLSITQLVRFERALSKALCLAAALAFSYAAALTATALRVTASLMLLDIRIGLSPVLIHSVTGVATYLTAMCVCFLAAHRAVTKLLNAGGSTHG